MTADDLMTMPGPAAYSRQEAAAGPARPDPYETTREITSMSDSTPNLQSPVLRTIAVLTDAHPGMTAPAADLAAYYGRAARVLGDTLSEHPHDLDVPLGRKLIAIFRNGAALTDPKGGTR